MVEHEKLIIYIEDDPEMINLVKIILSQRGLKLIGAVNGKEGLDLIGSNSPDLILLDLMMPDMDGWDVFQRLKANDTTSHIPVIIITAKSQPIDQLLGLSIAKVDDYISKPFHPQQLIDSVLRVLDSKKTLNL